MSAAQAPAQNAPIAAAAGGRSRPPAKWFYWIFAASGFAGLIYESFWAHYLKLLLGHAAYAQALVLAIFLLGLAGGAALAAKWSLRVARPLLWYVAAEAVVAVVAVYFHEIFVFAQGLALNSWLPAIQNDAAAEATKWTLAVALVLPQSILLGATFPLMSAGVLRIFPEAPGRVVSMLYFSNSAGAAAGVLFGGFALLPFAGLPGGVAFAGLINAAAAACVWALGHRFNCDGAPIAAPAAGLATPAAANESKRQFAGVVLAAAFITGAASFVYEIVWIRMLSLLLGSSAHNFEIMLSAFIAGLAIGGLWARRFADGKSPLRLLGIVQVAMGVLALWSLFAFPLFFNLLKTALVALPRSDNGYNLFLALGLGLSFAMMLPATVCAGMTLPLLCRQLYNSGGEAAIGKVYAINTAGAVVGVALALHVLLPLAGLQTALVVSAFADMALGLGLLALAARRLLPAGAATTAAATAIAVFFGGVNPQIAAAGVFRHPNIIELPKVVFYRDGKTASVAVTESRNDAGAVYRAIRTNGKSDAALFVKDHKAEKSYTSDETTMILLGLLPLLHAPQAKTAMNIGFGSGLTSRALLALPTLKQLDNVEIEPAMAAGARHLGGRVAPVFADERNRFIFNDAKTELARARGKHDIVVSEPSNPWVGGISGLFTQEFYARVVAALQPNGVFVQWLPLYEISADLVSSVTRALARHFGDFHFYLSTSGDMIIVATPAKRLPPRQDDIFAHAPARALFAHYGLQTGEDLQPLWLGDKNLLMPYFQSYAAPVNSDYHPYLQNNAPRAFFKKSSFSPQKTQMLMAPVMEALGAPPPAPEKFNLRPAPHSPMLQRALFAKRLFDERRLQNGDLQKRLRALRAAQCPLQQNADAKFMQDVGWLVNALMPTQPKDNMAEVWRMLEEIPCMAQLLARQDGHSAALYLRFLRALSLRDFAAVVELSEPLLPVLDLASETGQLVLLATLAAHYSLGNNADVVYLLQELPFVFPAALNVARLIGAHANARL